MSSIFGKKVDNKEQDAAKETQNFMDTHNYFSFVTRNERAAQQQQAKEKAEFENFKNSHNYAAYSKSVEAKSANSKSVEATKSAKQAADFNKFSSSHTPAEYFAPANAKKAQEANDVRKFMSSHTLENYRQSQKAKEEAAKTNRGFKSTIMDFFSRKKPVQEVAQTRSTTSTLTI